MCACACVCLCVYVCIFNKYLSCKLLKLECNIWGFCKQAICTYLSALRCLWKALYDGTHVLLHSSFFIESGMNKRRDLNIQTVEILKNCLKGGNRGLSIKRHVFSFSDFSDFQLLQLIDSCLFILASIDFCFQVFVWIPYVSNLTQISNWKWNCLKFKLDNRLQ